MHKISYGLRGIFHWEIVDAKTGRIEKRSPEKQNLILNQGLDYVAVRSFAENFTHCAIGGGTNAPLATDVGLSSEIQRTSNYKTTESGCLASLSGTVYSIKRTFDFPTETGSVQYGEIGWSYTGTAGNNLFSKSITIDENGAPGAVILSSGKFLRVVYTVQITLSQGAATAGDTNVAGWSGAGTQQVQYIGLKGVTSDGVTSNYDSGGVANEPSGAADIFISTSSTALSSLGAAADRSSGATTTSATLGAYVNGSYQITKYVFWGRNTASGSSFRSIGIGPAGSSASNSTFVHLFNANQAKDSSYELTIGFTYTWARI